MATEQELLAARIICRAVLPVIKVMIEDNPKLGRKFQGVTAKVQFVAEDPAGPVGAYLQFTDGAFEVVQGLAEDPDLVFRFANVAKMIGMFAGKPVLPSLGPLLKGLVTKPGLLINVFGVLLGMKLLMPTAKPKTPEMARLKVKMTLYMVSTALSQLNKGGDPDMIKWTEKQPERIYQWSVKDTDIACYLKIKAGQTKAGRGEYTRRKPFVHMIFRDIDAALAVLSNSVDTVSAIGMGLVENDGSPEYGGKIGDFMLKIAGMLS
ncbi:MAG TPA: hypothetical protein PKI11_04445 [Candidatus Hydrogenedentes bacterium]|nr:hypothetical protein [Candidatus Hydrogenedentota bacterium]